MVTAIKWSCNIFFYDVGRRLTSDVYDAYAYKLGLGQRTGVEVNEALGRLTKKTDKNYTSSLDIQAAIGQGNTVVSPIQLATYAATLANNGVRVIVAGLDMDYTGKPFGPMPALMATAEYVTKVHAICVRCGNLAHHSHRLTSDEKQVMLGAQDSYEPICRHCFNKLMNGEKA